MRTSVLKMRLTCFTPPILCGKMGGILPVRIMRGADGQVGQLTDEVELAFGEHRQPELVQAAVGADQVDEGQRVAAAVVVLDAVVDRLGAQLEDLVHRLDVLGADLTHMLQRVQSQMPLGSL